MKRNNYNIFVAHRREDMAVRAIYSTFSVDSPEMAALKQQIFPYLNEVLERDSLLSPTESPSLIEALKSAYGLAAFTSEVCLAIIFTDVAGDRQEIRDLLDAIPSNLQIQILAVGEAGAKNIAKLRHLTSRQLAFGIVVSNAATVKVTEEILADFLRSGNNFN